jgi:hypothetical protein
MKRRLIVFLCMLPFLAIAGIAEWILAVKQETAQIEKEQQSHAQAAASAEANPAPTAPSPVDIETRRLNDLRDRLEEVQAAAAQPPTGSAETFIQKTNERMQNIQSQLDALNADSQAVNQNAELYKQQQMAVHGSQQISLEQQIQNLDTLILELQVRLQNAQNTQPPQADPANPAEPVAAKIAQLKSRREQLEAQVRAQGIAAQTERSQATGEQLAEQAQIKDQRADLQRQLALLRSDLEYWQGQKNGASPDSQAAHVQQLEQEIREQEVRVNELQRLSAPPPSSQQ